MRRLLAESETLPQKFYTRPTIDVAQDLLGKVLVHGEAAGIIVETEAYLGGDDLASHSAAGITKRTEVIFGPPGRAYVYFIYGMYECLNIVAEPKGIAGCVLIRALEPIAGISLMQRRRPAAHKPQALASGPGRLTMAMDVTRALNGSSLITGPLKVRRQNDRPPVKIRTTTRIGITKCAHLPLRFLIDGNPFVSKP